MKEEYRINGFRQLERFYSVVYSGRFDIKPQQVSLYVFFLNQNNRNSWSEWFKCPFDLAMAGACIGSKETYYKSLEALSEFGLIKYIPGENGWKAAKISIVCLTKNEPVLVPQCEPLSEPLPEQVPVLLPRQVAVQVPEQVPVHLYKTLNLKLNNYITKNWMSLCDLPEKVNDENQKEKIIQDLRQDIHKIINPIAIPVDGPEEKVSEEKEKPLYSQMMDAYNALVIKQVGVPAKINGAEGKAMKDIISYMRNASKDKTDEGVLNSWRHLLENWVHLEEYYQGKLKLTEISSNFINLINQIKNGTVSKKKRQSGTGNNTSSTDNVNGLVDAFFAGKP